MKPRYSVDRGVDVPTKGLIPNGSKPTTKKSNGEEVSRTVGYSEALIDKLGGKAKVKCEGKNWNVFKEGVWKIVKEDRLKPLAIACIDPQNRNHLKVNDLMSFTNSERQLTGEEEFYGCMRWHPEDNTRYILNCPSNVLVVDFISGKLVDEVRHKPEFMFTTMLGADYDDSARCPLFYKTSREALPDREDRQVLLLHGAYWLYPSCKIETVGFCEGVGSNGKSVLTEAMISAIGRENRLALTLHEICNKDQKQIHRLKNKLVNVSGENEVDFVKDSSMFKSLASGEVFETSKIYEQGFSMETYCKFMFLINRMAQFKGGTDAENRRVSIIKFTQQFLGDSKDVSLREKLPEEKAGILRLLVERLPLVATMNSFPVGGVSSKIAHEQFRLNNNPVKLFADKHLEITGDARDYVRRDVVSRKWIEFAMEQNISKTDSGEFYKELYRCTPVRPSRIRIQGRLNYIVLGIKSVLG